MPITATTESAIVTGSTHAAEPPAPVARILAHLKLVRSELTQIRGHSVHIDGEAAFACGEALGAVKRAIALLER
jgi:hypothetical protein